MPGKGMQVTTRRPDMRMQTVRAALSFDGRIGSHGERTGQQSCAVIERNLNIAGGHVAHWRGYNRFEPGLN
jgi:hypothetical protein